MFDFVFPYVNPLDLEWQSLYRMYYRSQDANFISSPRFRENILLKYVFRSIDKYMPWVDRVVLILFSDKQILPWMNLNNIKIVKHIEFIPIKYIPVFNSTTIEMFLPKIKGLNDNIIYSNDDLILLQNTTKEDFFTKDNKPKLFYTIRSIDAESLFQISVKNTFNMVRDENHNFVKNDQYIRPSHLLHPMNKKILNEVWDKYHFSMEKHITRFRNNYVNINQYIYCDYAILKNEATLSDNNGSYINVVNNNDLLKIESLFNNPNDKLSLCINDTETTNQDIIKQLSSILEKKFPEKSKYEF